MLLLLDEGSSAKVDDGFFGDMVQKLSQMMLWHVNKFRENHQNIEVYPDIEKYYKLLCRIRLTLLTATFLVAQPAFERLLSRRVVNDTLCDSEFFVDATENGSCNVANVARSISYLHFGLV